MDSCSSARLLIGMVEDPFCLWSIGTYIIASLGAALASDIGFLIVMRIIEAFGACGMMVCAFAIVRDIFIGSELAEIYSYLNGAISLSPLFAPFLGGYLYAWFGWRAPFFALGVSGLCIFVLIYSGLIETLSKKSTRLNFLMVFRRYKRILKHKSFLVFTAIAAGQLAAFFTFFSISPYILIKQLHVPETRFGLYFGIEGVMFLTGSIVAGRLNLRIGRRRLVLLGSVLSAIAGIVMWAFTLWYGTTMLTFILPMCISAIGGAMLLGGTAAGALAPFARMAGTASALYGMIEFTFAMLVSAIVMLWPITSNIPLAVVLTAFGTLAVTLMLSFRPK